MTGQELFAHVVGIMGESMENATSYEAAIIPQINAILAKTFKLENNNREYKNLTLETPLPILTTVPVIDSLTDTIDYQENVLYNVVAYGIARFMALSDKDTTSAGFYETAFADGMNSESKLIPSEIEDFFDTGDE